MGNKIESQAFRASLYSLASIREFISEKGKAAGLSHKQNYGLCLAVDEIVTNIINYGYPKSEHVGDASIEIFISRNGRELTVITEDTAVPFNPLEHKEARAEDLDLPLEQRPIGGLGIMLAKTSVDRFAYEYENGKNKNIFTVCLQSDRTEKSTF
jgi:anti-sigma regulatory factor (Ser/Thr protein kinase)